jgi:iron complex outermembrane receptor protein
MATKNTQRSSQVHHPLFLLEFGMKHTKTTLSVSVIALIAYGAMAQAQDILDLDDIIVDGESSIGLYGENIAQSSATVTKTGTAILETPRSISVVTKQNLADTGAQDIEEALSYAAGVTTGIFGADPRSDWYKVRGFNPSTYHDGLQSRFDYYNVSKPEAYMVESVEILRGPASTLFGNSSVGGAVNSTSKVAGLGSGDQYQVQIGTDNRVQAGVDFSGVLDEEGTLEYRFVGMLRDSDGSLDGTQDDALSLAPSLVWTPNDDTKISFLMNYQDTQASPISQFAPIYGTLWEGPYGYLPDGFNIGEPEDVLDVSQFSATAKIEHQLNDTWSLNASARYMESEGKYQHSFWQWSGDYGYNADGYADRAFYLTEFDTQSFTADVNAIADYFVGDVHMNSFIGASVTTAAYDTDWVYDWWSLNPVDPFDTVSTGYPDYTLTDYDTNTLNEYGLYIQNRATFGNNTFLDFGARYADISIGSEANETGDYTETQANSDFTYNVALTHVFASGLTAYLSYAESFNQEAIGEDYDGNVFDPTYGTQYEAGLKFQPIGTQSLFTLSYFDLTKSNILLTDPVNAGFQYQDGAAQTAGFEASAQMEFGDFYVDASFNHLTKNENEAGYQISAVSNDTGAIWVGYRPSEGALEGWKFGAGARYTGKRSDGTDTVFVPSTTLLDAMVGYEYEGLDITLNVRNLADNNYVASCESYTCFIGEGRSATLTLTKNF